MRTNPKKQTKMDAQCPNVCAGFTADPENTEMTVVVKLDQLALIDGADAQLSLDGRDDRRSLEECASKVLNRSRHLRLAARQLVVEPNDGNIFLSSALLGFDQTSCAIAADYETACDFGIEGTAMSSFLDTTIKR